jgi:hypothetical protein
MIDRSILDFGLSESETERFGLRFLRQSKIQNLKSKMADVVYGGGMWPIVRSVCAYC